MTTKRAPSMLSLWLDDLKHFPLLVLLFLLVIATAMSIIYVSHSHRQLTINRDELGSVRDQLDIEWRHLTIEQNALTEHSRIERIAMQQLNMVRPEPEQEVLVPWQ